MSVQLDYLAFGAHPDDVELGCGGTLVKLVQLGYKTGIVDLTEGEMASRGTVAERYKESAKSAKILGVAFRENLKIPDASIEVNEENKLKVIRAIRSYRPKVVFVPYANDRHPDHIHASRLVTEAAFYSGLPKILPEMEAHRPRRVVYYMATYEFEPKFLVDITEQFPLKLKALQAYRSQFYNPNWPGKNTFVSSRWFIEAVEFRARHFGWLAGVKYAEPFWVREPLLMDDPTTALIQNIL